MSSSNSHNPGRLQKFRSFVRSGLSSKRPYGALITTALSSVTNFGLSVAIARSGSVSEVAHFAIGFAGFLAISGLTRSMISEPSAARLLSREALRTAGRQVAFYGLCFSLPVLLIGLVSGQLYLAAAGLFGHATAIYDFTKFSSTVFGRPRIAVVQESLRTVGVGIFLFVPAIASQPLRLFLIWLVATAISGYCSASVQRISAKPAWTNRVIPAKESTSYAMDYLLGSGTTQITTFALGGLAVPSVNASIRGAGTLLGPITMIATSIRALIIPFLSRKLRHDNDLSPAVHVSISLVIAALPLIIFVNFIPDAWGITLLGDTWQITTVILPILSAELLSSLLTHVPFAGHRSVGAYQRTLLIRTVLAPTRFATIIISAAMGGYIAAAYAMLGTSLIGFVVWWTSYVKLMKKGDSN